MDNRRCAELLQELLADPVQFSNDGPKANALLQAFFDGEPADTLRPLLGSTIVPVQRVAMFVASELGILAKDLIDDVIPWLYSEDRYMQYYAMEIIAVCSHGEQASRFALVVHMLESDDEVLRGLAMRLTSRVDISQIRAARTSLVGSLASWRSHVRGLDTLTSGERLGPATISPMLRSSDRLVRWYGAIAAKRVSRMFPMLIAELASNDDPEVREFFEWEQSSYG
jgi:hypothetical protein